MIAERVRIGEPDAQKQRVEARLHVRRQGAARPHFGERFAQIRANVLVGTALVE